MQTQIEWGIVVLTTTSKLKDYISPWEVTSIFLNDVQKYIGCNLLIINIHLVKCNKVLRI